MGSRMGQRSGRRGRKRSRKTRDRKMRRAKAIAGMGAPTLIRKETEDVEEEHGT